MFPMHEDGSKCGCGFCKSVKDVYNKVKLYFQRRNKKTKNMSIKLLLGDDY